MFSSGVTAAVAREKVDRMHREARKARETRDVAAGRPSGGGRPERSRRAERGVRRGRELTRRLGGVPASLAAEVYPAEPGHRVTARR